MIHVLIFGGLIAALNSNPSGGAEAFLGICLAAFILYMPIEAYHTAKSRQTGPPASEELATSMHREHTPYGAVILIGLGVFLLLANFGLLEWDWFSRAWPAALIVLGAWVLVDRLRRTGS
jgi:hypothetical protein